MGERVSILPNGNLDEVVVAGGCHLERMDKNKWFLACYRKDGSSFVLWFSGKITMTEERPALGKGS
jgi:hypothetical protein